MTGSKFGAAAETKKAGSGRLAAKLAVLAITGALLSACVVYPAGPGYYPPGVYIGGGGYYHHGWYR